MKNCVRFMLVACFCAAMIGLQPAARAAGNSAAPDFTLPTLGGEKIALSQYKGKQPVLLFFWTTWCPFCLKEIKTLNGQRQEYTDKGVAILAVNAGENAAAVGRLVKNYNIGLTVLLDEEDSTTRSYHVLGVPTFVVVDTAGMIRYSGTHFPKDELEAVCAP